MTAVRRSMAYSTYSCVRNARSAWRAANDKCLRSRPASRPPRIFVEWNRRVEPRATMSDVLVDLPLRLASATAPSDLSDFCPMPGRKPPPRFQSIMDNVRLIALAPTKRRQSQQRRRRLRRGRFTVSLRIRLQNPRSQEIRNGEGQGCRDEQGCDMESAKKSSPSCRETNLVRTGLAA